MLTSAHLGVLSSPTRVQGSRMRFRISGAVFQNYVSCVAVAIIVATIHPFAFILIP